jgi:hypothetical protein
MGARRLRAAAPIFALSLWLATAASPAHAYGAGMDIGNLGIIDSSWYYNAILLQNIRNQEERLNAERKRPESSALASTAPLSFKPEAARGAQAALLAQSYPPTARPEAERTFREMLDGFAKIERQFGLPRNDIGVALAAFLAGSWSAYRNTEFPDAYFKPLVQQMQGILASQPAFARASDADKQQMYEQMAILGMFMATTQLALKERGNAQIERRLRDAGKGYLEKFLKTDADRVRPTATGLVVQ